MATVVSALLLLLAVQSYGGSAPWGRERPTVIHGEVRRGEAFEQSLGDGLSFRLSPNEQGWRIEVGDARNDFTQCATPPFHGLTPMDIEGGPDRDVDADGKRWFNFVLTAGDQERQCTEIDQLLHDDDGSARADSDLSTKPRQKERITGRGWLKITKVTGDLEAIAFDAEVALHGALRLWLRPSRYVIPTNYTGWVGVSGGVPGAAPAPLAGGFYQLRVPASGLLRTSTLVRTDGRDAAYVFANGAPLPDSGPRKRVWGSWHVGARQCGAYLMFFVGTRQQYVKARKAGPPQNIRCD